MNMHYRGLAIILSFLCFGLNAQATFELTKFPKNNQLIPRNPATNIGTYNIEGTVLPASNIVQLVVKISKNDVFERSYTQIIPTNTPKFQFSIPIAIKAELKNYRVELTGLRNNLEVALAKAENVVAGDVFIINGQSNCIGRTEPVDLNPFMRSYTEQFGWADVDYTSPSKWGPRMARRIIEKEQIPVAIFCEAYGGVIQTWFMRRAVNPYTDGNYGIIYNRLKKAEVEKNVRALFWWQGESDGWETPLDSFKTQFKTLFNQWKEDYNTPVFYFQIRFRACTHVKPDIFEAQRQLANEIPNIEILSSNPALSHDGCHFKYENGYDLIGESAYNILAGKLYNRSTVNTRPPNISEAFFSATNEITIKMKNVTGNLRSVGTPWADFKLEGCRAQITGGFVADYRIKLNFSGDTTGMTGISYLSHIDSFSQNWVVNASNVGILLFYNVPVNKRQLTDTAFLPKTTEGSDFELAETVVLHAVSLRFLSNLKSRKHIYIVNTMGQVVLDQRVGGDLEAVEIKISNLPKGVYFIQLGIENQAIKQFSRAQKFIHL
jgi:hypothetical protein